MKKNLRIVSAAAAALLAVAPVAATSVSTVFADGTQITVPVNGNSATNSTEAKMTLDITNVSSLRDGDTPTKANAVINVSQLPSGATVNPAKVDIYKVGTDGKVADNASPVKDKLESNNTYIARVIVKVSGLKDFANTAAADNKFSINGKSVAVDNNGISSEVPVDSASFTIPDPTKTGTPYVKENSTNTAVDSGSIDLGSINTVSGLENAIDATKKDSSSNAGKYSVVTTGEASAKFVDLQQDIKDSLKAAGVTVKSDGSFDRPATPFTINARLSATNGTTSTFPIRVNINSSIGGDAYPQFTWKDATTGSDISTPVSGDQTISSIDAVKGGEALNYIPVNGVVNNDAIKALFTATVNKANNKITLPVAVDSSKVNTKVAGRYPVTVSATNADKKTSKVTFYITVGVKGASYKTVQSDGDVPVYKIDGNTVTDTKTTVKNGDQIAVFGETIKIGDKTYAHINSADSDLYVESKYVDGSFKPAEKTSKTVMHNAYIYDKDHKRVGTKTLAAYTKVDVLGATTKLADGSLVYQIGDNQYVMADNIDGTVRTLSHNAYVYKTSKKRADSRVLRKGAKVTTYGSPYTFKNGKAYYRIGGPSKQYVKVANFN